MTFHFYQLVHGDGTFRDRDLINAMGIIRHVTDEIDVINCSAGLDHAGDPDRDCTADSAECLASTRVQEVVEDDVAMVTAAGDDLQTDGMCCPGTIASVISAAGVIPKCTASIETNTSGFGNLHELGQQQRPPNAFWIDSDHDHHYDGTYCTNRGCAPGMKCLENRRYEPWEHNHAFGRHTPDILAPVVIPVKEEDARPYLAGGSSYAPPFVTGQIANILSSLGEADRDPDPKSIRRGLREAQKEIPESEIGMLSGYEFGDWFGQRYGLDFQLESDDDSEVFFTVVDRSSTFE